MSTFTYSCKANSLAAGRFQFNFRLVTSKLTLVNYDSGISYEIAFRGMPLDLADDKSTLGQAMAWCRKTTSHYLRQCWPRSMSPNGLTRPQWANSSWHCFPPGPLPLTCFRFTGTYIYIYIYIYWEIMNRSQKYFVLQSIPPVCMYFTYPKIKKKSYF